MPRPELHACIEVLPKGKLPGVRGEFTSAVSDFRGTFKSDNETLRKTVPKPFAGSVFLDQRGAPPPSQYSSRAVTPQYGSPPPPLGQPRYNNGSPSFIPAGYQYTPSASSASAARDGLYTVPETWNIHRQEHIMGDMRLEAAGVRTTTSTPTASPWTTPTGKPPGGWSVAGQLAEGW